MKELLKDQATPGKPNWLGFVEKIILPVLLGIGTVMLALKVGMKMILS